MSTATLETHRIPPIDEGLIKSKLRYEEMLDARERYDEEIVRLNAEKQRLKDRRDQLIEAFKEGRETLLYNHWTSLGLMGCAACGEPKRIAELEPYFLEIRYRGGSLEHFLYQTACLNCRQSLVGQKTSYVAFLEVEGIPELEGGKYFFHYPNGRFELIWTPKVWKIPEQPEFRGLFFQSYGLPILPEEVMPTFDANNIDHIFPPRRKP